MADAHEARLARLEAHVAALTSIAISEDRSPELSPFAREVARIVVDIPWGETRTYSDVAREAGSPGALQGVGKALTAVASAGIPVPWWRVVRKDGRLTGPFRAQRRLLLAAEGIMFSEPQRRTEDNGTVRAR